MHASDTLREAHAEETQTRRATTGCTKVSHEGGPMSHLQGLTCKVSLAMSHLQCLTCKVSLPKVSLPPSLPDPLNDPSLSFGTPASGNPVET
jgi:hypothetical protein